MGIEREKRDGFSWWEGEMRGERVKVKVCLCVCVCGGGEGGSAWTITLNLLGAVANILSLCPCVTHTFSSPSQSRTYPSLQLRINFSVSIWLVPSAPYYLLLLAAFSHFFRPLLSLILPSIFFPLPIQSRYFFFPLDLFCCCRPPPSPPLRAFFG